jgi:hypothetical protein
MLCAPALVSCYDQGPAAGDDASARCVTVDDSKQIILETAQNIYKEIPADVEAGDSFSPMTGMTVTVLSVSENPRGAELNIVLEECAFSLLKSVISGTVNADLVMDDGVFQMTLNTMEDQPLDVTGPGLEDAAVDLKDLTVYVNPGEGSGFQGTIIINGKEYILDEIITMEQALAILAEALGKVSWDDVADRIKNGDDSTSARFAVPIGNIYNQDGLMIDLVLELNMTEPGALLTFTFDDYLLSQGSISDQTLSGDMEAFASFYSLTVLKIVVNTGDDPLYVNTGILGIKIPLAFRDVTLYFDLLTMDLAEDPSPSGTIYLAGIPVGLDSVWFEFLMSLF